LFSLFATHRSHFRSSQRRKVTTEVKSCHSQPGPFCPFCASPFGGLEGLISARSDSMECRSLRMLSSPRPSPSTGSNFNPSFFSECKGIRSIFRSPGIDIWACPPTTGATIHYLRSAAARHSVLHAGMPARLKSRNPDDQSLIWIVSRWSFPNCASSPVTLARLGSAKCSHCL